MDRLAAALAALALAASAHAAPPAQRAVDVTLDPGKAHEECQKLGKGDKRRFHWKSSAPVDFNVHYHEGKEVLYPVKRDAMRGDGGTFTAKTEQEYCWMWSARKAPARVEGAVEVGSP